MDCRTGAVMTEEKMLYQISMQPGNAKYYKNVPYQREREKTGRNEPCPCGSGTKFKKCCYMNAK